MNKKLLAIAVGAAMVAGATAATAGDEPTFYGKIHLSVDMLDNNDPAAGADADGIYVSSNSSRLGIKGAVDLDGGLKAIYKYEMSTDYDNNALAGSRNAYLGLKGGFGQVIVGRHDMPFKTVGRNNDLFGDTIGDNRAITRAKIGPDDWAARSSDVIMYSNTFGAVDLTLAYVAEDEAGDDSEDMAIGIDYKQGPVSVMFAHEIHGMGDAVGAKDSTGNVLAGSYKMDNMKFHAGYGAVSDIGTGSGLDATVMTVAAAFTSGMNTFKLQYTANEVDDNGTKADSTVTAVGVDHKLGKKTSVYAVYAMIANDAGNDFGINDSGGHGAVLDGVDGEDTGGFSLGMIHKF
jgi:predicted porin